MQSRPEEEALLKCSSRCLQDLLTFAISGIATRWNWKSHSMTRRWLWSRDGTGCARPRDEVVGIR